jgi:hypothetical protein
MKGLIYIGKVRSYGTNGLEAAKKSATSETKINKNVKITKIEKEEEKKKEYRCTCCGDSWIKPDGHFNKSKSPLFAGNDGYVNICYSCRDKYYYSLTDFYCGNEEKAIERMCQIFDWLFHEKPLSASKQISVDRSRVGDYSNKLNLGQTIKEGTTYLDTIRIRAEEEKERVIESLDDVKDFKKAKLKTVKFFGTGFADDDYAFLEDEYLDWTTRHECNTKAQEEVFKQICFAQLDILKAKRANLPTKDLTKTLQDLLATANLQPKQTKDNTLAEQNTFGTLIRKWENEKPIPEPDEEWKDVDGIVRYITVYFLGHLCKMMGIKNSYARMYETEMAKYKVDKPEYEDDDEALFDAVFGGELDDSDQ